tara:strand:- start:677 stop:1060 length:384 start_codon:yes stop_codon:yes gene_type:complete
VDENILSNSRYQAKQAIMHVLRRLPTEASDSAKYFADRLLDCRGMCLTNEDISVLAAESMIRALRDAGCEEQFLRTELELLASTYGIEISELAAMMAMYVDSKKQIFWKPTAIAAGIGIAAITVLGG